MALFRLVVRPGWRVMENCHIQVPSSSGLWYFDRERLLAVASRMWIRPGELPRPMTEGTHMKKTMIVALLAAAGAATTTLGVVRETATIPTAQSFGRQGNPSNTIVTATLTGTWDNGGTQTPYTVRQVVVGMTLASGFMNEGSILVTAPGGEQFIISPRRGGTSPQTYSGLVTIPVSQISNVAGTWTFEFFDLWDDGGSTGVDSTFTDVTIGFDDDVPVTGANPGQLENISLSNVLSDGVAAGGFVTTGFTVSGSINSASAVRITGTATSLRSNPATSTTASAVANMRFALVRPDTGVSATVTPTWVGIGGVGGTSPSSSTFTALVPLPAVQSVNGDWVLRSFQTIDFPGGPDVGMRDVTLSFIGPPPATAISPVDGGAWASATGNIASAGGVQWFTFTTPAFGTGGALDIDTVGSNLSPANDTSIGLYTGAGTLIDADNDDSDGLLSQLSYGSGSRLASGDGLRFSGQDGSTAGTAGNIGSSTQYWLAVAGGNGTYTAGFTPPAGDNTGPVTARVRTWSAAAPTDPATPPSSAINLGNFGAEGATESVVTSSWTMESAQEVKWFRFSIPADVTGGGTAYLDLDTDLSNPGGALLTGNVNDTHLALWDNNGTFRVSDDDSGIDQRSALSFGNTVLIREANVPTPPNAAGAARNGRNSTGINATLAAGTYYASVATFLPTYAFGFTVNPDATRSDVGDRVLAIRTNFAAPVTCVCCNLSNVAGPNQSTTPDNELTADDIIVFLGWYFANDPRANVAGPNQSTTPDNELTADDIIVFLGRYFTGC
jgi:hypothetical protein